MHENCSAPDGICTADLCLERDSYELERLSEDILRDSIGGCNTVAMLFGTLASIDKAIVSLQKRKTQAEHKVHALAFVAELIA